MQQTLRLKAFVEQLPLAPYCLLAGLGALIGSALLVLAARFAAYALGFHLQLGSDASIPLHLGNVAAVVFVVPALESGLLIGLLWLLRRIGLAPGAACLVSALLWAVAHGLVQPVRFFGSLWSFIVFGASYLHWRRTSGVHGFIGAAGSHVVVNSAAVAAAFVGGA